MAKPLPRRSNLQWKYARLYKRKMEKLAEAEKTADEL